ncbi:MAG: response regulator [Pirellulales bacterium]|nr:response regulator [Planctomycetales bacterium]
MATVLIVDDSPVDMRLARGILDKSGAFELVFATNGIEAVTQLEESQPDIVVTDMQMPEMNGLELVEHVRARHPLVPVILMTAHGSEDLAVEALEKGAASYVPKDNLSRDLLDTVENVLAVARADRRHDRLMDCLVHSEICLEIENDPALIPPLVDQLQDAVARMSLCDDTGRIRLGIALEEALLNALYHGNLELTTDELREESSALVESGGDSVIDRRRRQSPYSDRKVRVTARMNRDEASFVIQDEGPGFAAHANGEADASQNLSRESGRGLVLMRSLMDEVRFNDEGNEVTLIKRCEQINRG